MYVSTFHSIHSPHYHLTAEEHGPSVDVDEDSDESEVDLARYKKKKSTITVDEDEDGYPVLPSREELVRLKVDDAQGFIRAYITKSYRE